MKKYSPIKLTIIIIIAFILFGVFGYLHRENSYTETWLVCEYPNKYTNYTETLKFRYIDELYGYYREELLETATKEKLEEEYKYFEDIKNGLEESETFSYDIKKQQNSLLIKTYIEVKEQKEFFDYYMKDMKITSTDTIDLIQVELEGLGYTCKVSKK